MKVTMPRSECANTLGNRRHGWLHQFRETILYDWYEFRTALSSSETIMNLCSPQRRTTSRLFLVHIISPCDCSPWVSGGQRVAAANEKGSMHEANVGTGKG